MRGPAKIATYISVTMTLLGFGLIGIAWNGAAELDFIQGQFPYALSGGLGGMGLVITGMAVMAIQTQRTITAQRTRDLGRLQQEVDHLLRLVVQPGPGEVIEDETIIDVGAQTVVRTINRVPDTGRAPQAAAQAPQGEGFAPAPRVTYEQPEAGEAEEPATPVAVIDREEDAASIAERDETAPPPDVAWAPPGDEQERDRVREVLAEVSGVGPAKQRSLAERFGTVAALREASVEQLTAVPGISPTLGERIKGALR
jgi:predicted flap endonuclease-1-like 5' DNA nuclease